MNKAERNRCMFAVPDLITHPTNEKIVYKRDRYMGKGSSAICYEIVDSNTNQHHVVKAIPLAFITTSRHRTSLKREVEIHQAVSRDSHPNIVRFFGSFQDARFYYVIMELCPNKSLYEMHKRRGALKDCEIRYFLRPLAEGILYLHRQGIIHRDLKLANLFLDANMNLKIGDFGLATRMAENDLNKTMCGTPNYIAPEVIDKRGHDQAADNWSIGCLLYVLATGFAPFETKTIEATYEKIKKVDFKPDYITNIQLRDLVLKLLSHDPSLRPSAADILKHPFLLNVYIPTQLPVSCLTTKPHDGRLSITPIDVDLLQKSETDPPTPLEASSDSRNKTLVKVEKENESDNKENVPGSSRIGALEESCTSWEIDPAGYDIKKLRQQLQHWKTPTLHMKQNKSDLKIEQHQDPSSSPIYYVTRWVDLHEKYGLGYELSDESTSVLFADKTRMSVMQDGTCLYVLADGIEVSSEDCNRSQSVRDDFDRKRAIVEYFRAYMQKFLKQATNSNQSDGETLKNEKRIARLPYLNNWYRTKDFICFHFTNGIVQINFMSHAKYPHVKMILCPQMKAISFINANNDMQTFKFSTLKELSLDQDFRTKLAIAAKAVETSIGWQMFK